MYFEMTFSKRAALSLLVSASPTSLQVSSSSQCKGQTQFPSYSQRRVKYTHGGTTYTLATALLDRSRYDLQTLPEACQNRWGIQESDKSSELLLGVEQFHGQTERSVKQEL